MMKYPFDEAFQAQQPLVVINGNVLAKTGSSLAVAVLETAAGVRHPLSVVGTSDAIWRMAIRASLPAIEAILLQDLPRQVAELRTDSLAYFADYLVPAFLHREYSEDCYASQPSAARPREIDWTTEVAHVARTIPKPEMEQPSLWILGRVWLLRQGDGSKNCWRVHADNTSYSLTGDFSFVSTLAARWRQQVARYVAYVAAELASQVGELESVAQARQELAECGSVERGDLVFVAGAPPYLAHVVPQHYNRTLSRVVNRDLAVAAPFTLPPNLNRSSFAVFQRRGREWRATTLPHGLCLGPDPPAYEQDSPGIALAALLRWAAQRISANGIFHSSDESDTTTDDYQY
jgi:hypothetical protein